VAGKRKSAAQGGGVFTKTECCGKKIQPFLATVPGGSNLHRAAEPTNYKKGLYDPRDKKEKKSSGVPESASSTPYGLKNHRALERP